MLTQTPKTSSIESPEPDNIRRVGFLSGQIDVPDDFDDMGEAEITIKHSLGRDDFKVDADLLRRGLLENGYNELSITSQHAMATAHLPPIHKDLFDRLLIAQA